MRVLAEGWPRIEDALEPRFEEGQRDLSEKCWDYPVRVAPLGVLIGADGGPTTWFPCEWHH